MTIVKLLDSPTCHTIEAYRANYIAKWSHPKKNSLKLWNLYMVKFYEDAFLAKDLSLFSSNFER